MASHVSSSLEQAEAFIKDLSIFSDGWWQISEFRLDDPNHDNDALSSRFYGNKGKLLKKVETRINRAIKAFDKENPKGYKE